MSAFHDQITSRAYPQNGFRTGTIKLATSHRDNHINLIATEGMGRVGSQTQQLNMTLHPETAKQLRDMLLKVYPVETKTEAVVGTAPRMMYADEFLKTMSADAKPSLKVGDKVRVSTYRHGAFQHGLEGIVTRTDRASANFPIEVDFQTSPRRAPFRFNQYAPTDLQVIGIDPDAGQFIVALKEDGVYKPSAKPFIHTSEKAAKAEAERLAKLHGGTFHVLEAIFEADRAPAIIPPVKTKTL